MENINLLLIIGSAILISLGSGKAINRFKFPMVVGYVIIGVILGRSFLNILKPSIVEKASLLNDLALGIIAFMIGGELNFIRLKNIGKAIFFITVFEALGAFFLVSISTYILTRKTPLSLILGAIASATAPAATVAVINQYKAKGPLTTTILGIVGSDDAIALMIYSFASNLAYHFITHDSLSLLMIILNPLKKIIFSILLGGAIGGILSYILNKIKSKEESFTIAIGAFLLAEGLALQFDLSELLLIMSLAIVGTNLAFRKFNSIMNNLHFIGLPLISAFFCLAGTKLNINLLPKIGVLGLVYLLARLSGKFFGAKLGAKIGSAPEIVKKYIGLCLWPQIGVAVALAILVERDFTQLGAAGHNLANIAINILLFTTIFTEIIGPLATKFALIKAKEIKSK